MLEVQWYCLTIGWVFCKAKTSFYRWCAEFERFGSIFVDNGWTIGFCDKMNFKPNSSLTLSQVTFCNYNDVIGRAGRSHVWQPYVKHWQVHKMCTVFLLYVTFYCVWIGRMFVCYSEAEHFLMAPSFVTECICAFRRTCATWTLITRQYSYQRSCQAFPSVQSLWMN